MDETYRTEADTLEAFWISNGCKHIEIKQARDTSRATSDPGPAIHSFWAEDHKALRLLQATNFQHQCLVIARPTTWL